MEVVTAARSHSSVEWSKEEEEGCQPPLPSIGIGGRRGGKWKRRRRRRRTPPKLQEKEEGNEPTEGRDHGRFGDPFKGNGLTIYPF